MEKIRLDAAGTDASQLLITPILGERGHRCQIAPETDDRIAVDGGHQVSVRKILVPEMERVCTIGVVRPAAEPCPPHIDTGLLALQILE